jgi:4-diphosphocytidyl-2-C-methyl-D-erythritol kinase
VTAQAQPQQTNVPLTVFSPAKINVYLRILGKRPDGYHDLETLMLPLEFGDEITFRPNKHGLSLVCDNPTLPTDDSNLALRAARRLADRYGVKQGATITLTKRTPLAAGLGGGSSNAAAVLLGLKQFWGLDTDDSVLHELAAAMGSDINFFLSGGAALCRGRGEQIEAIPCRLSATVLLVNPGFGISTKWAYEAWANAAAESRLTASTAPVSLLLRALAEDDLNGVSRCLFNSLEAPSIRKFPVLEPIKDAMRNDGASGALMSGSGATVFGLFADPKTAEKSAVRIREQFGPSMWTKVTRFGSPCNR